MNLMKRSAGFALALVFAIVSAAAVDLWLDYRQTRADFEATATDLSKVVERHILDTLEQADLSFDELAARVVADGGPQRMREPERFAALATMCRAITGCMFAAAVDPRGRTVALTALPGDPGLDVSRQQFFLGPQHVPGLYVDAAVVTPLTGKPIVFNIGKAVRARDGTLLAVLVAGMSTEHFTDFYRLMGYTLAPTITIFKGNGDIVARSPDMHVFVGRNNARSPLFTRYLREAPQGIYDSVSGLDGKERVASYRSIRHYDLIVFAGVEKHVVFRAWRARAWRNLVVLSALLTVTLALVGLAYRSLREQEALLRRNLQLDELAQLDGLTGIPNRRAFDGAAEREWATHQRNGTPLTLLMIDIDFFKRYNDTYGHLAGDECLRRVARALEACVQRRVDLLARVGGEEFAAILPADEDGALVVAERMRRDVEALAILHGSSDAAKVVTVSIGIASTDRHRPQDIAGLMALADGALYQAKNAGRNRIGIARAGVPGPLPANTA